MSLSRLVSRVTEWLRRVLLAVRVSVLLQAIQGMSAAVALCIEAQGSTPHGLQGNPQPHILMK